MNFSNILSTLKSGRLWMHISAVMAFVVVFLIGLLWGLNIYTRHGQGIDVPNVKGLLFSEAEYKLSEMNLEALVVDSDYVKSKPAGVILDQTPAFGTRVKRNRTIYLTINSSSSPTLVIPDLADNASMRQGQVKLKAMGFNLGVTEYVEGEKDWLYAIKYRGRKVYAGDRVPSDATLILVVGNGFYEGNDSTKQYSIDDIGDYSTDVEVESTGSTPNPQSSEPKTKTKATVPAKKENKPDDWF